VNVCVSVCVCRFVFFVFAKMMQVNANKSANANANANVHGDSSPLGRRLLGACGNNLVRLPIYQHLVEISHFCCVKAPGLGDCKRHCIDLILCLLQSPNRGSFHARQNEKFQLDAGINMRDTACFSNHSYLWVRFSIPILMLNVSLLDHWICFFYFPILIGLFFTLSFVGWKIIIHHVACPVVS